MLRSQARIEVQQLLQQQQHSSHLHQTWTEDTTRGTMRKLLFTHRCTQHNTPAHFSHCSSPEVSAKVPVLVHITVSTDRHCSGCICLRRRS